MPTPEPTPEPTPAPTSDDGHNNNTFPLYGIILIAVFGGLVFLWGCYFLIKNYASTKKGPQNKPLTRQTLFF